eukprot:TRINITY_DN3084_c0_g1_i5.p1 TRINITY_DN3084_c0_g1~~TRINITY_DN3084_c0_g1_i5.p1  ORF type:complete len:609 (+),score=130.49 TRINITY_DN3084_c0_g1_i5:2-1828(+)
MFFFLMIRRPPRSTQSRSSAASDVYKRQVHGGYIEKAVIQNMESINEKILIEFVLKKKKERERPKVIVIFEECGTMVLQYLRPKDMRNIGRVSRFFANYISCYEVLYGVQEILAIEKLGVDERQRSASPVQKEEAVTKEESKEMKLLVRPNTARLTAQLQRGRSLPKMKPKLLMSTTFANGFNGDKSKPMTKSILKTKKFHFTQKDTDGSQFLPRPKYFNINLNKGITTPQELDQLQWLLRDWVLELRKLEEKLQYKSEQGDSLTEEISFWVDSTKILKIFQEETKLKFVVDIENILTNAVKSSTNAVSMRKMFELYKRKKQQLIDRHTTFSAIAERISMVEKPLKAMIWCDIQEMAKQAHLIFEVFGHLDMKVFLEPALAITQKLILLLSRKLRTLGFDLPSLFQVDGLKRNALVVQFSLEILDELQLFYDQNMKHLASGGPPHSFLVASKLGHCRHVLGLTADALRVLSKVEAKRRHNAEKMRIESLVPVQVKEFEVRVGRLFEFGRQSAPKGDILEETKRGDIEDFFSQFRSKVERLKAFMTQSAAEVRQTAENTSNRRPTSKATLRPVKPATETKQREETKGEEETGDEFGESLLDVSMTWRVS